MKSSLPEILACPKCQDSPACTERGGDDIIEGTLGCRGCGAGRFVEIAGQAGAHVVGDPCIE